MAEETLLLQASKDGDNAAFEQIVNKYQSLVCAITFSGTGRVDTSEELAQETFLNAWKKLSQLKDLSGFQAWLCAIARNKLNNYYRRKKSVSLEAAGIAEITDTSPDPSETLITQEEHIMLEQALMHIPAEYREPLVMYYRQQKSTRQVAIALDLNESTVRTRLHRAKQMLREQIATGLEKTIEKTAPNKTFTKAVMLAVAATTVGISAGTNAASTTANTAGTSTSTGITAVMSTITAKIITAVAVVAVVTGAIIYTQTNKTSKLPQQQTNSITPNTQQAIPTPKNTVPTIKQHPVTPSNIIENQANIPPEPQNNVAAKTTPIEAPAAVNAPENLVENIDQPEKC
ncbi:MAG: sigma-70 family RNA polymerase sigma factor, partial [Anaerohalosphaera sp.]|nr:sigma-70 family RNA polymerase sigma factor [Anaerohalosphaera sp.]